VTAARRAGRPGRAADPASRPLACAPALGQRACAPAGTQTTAHATDHRHNFNRKYPLRPVRHTSDARKKSGGGRTEVAKEGLGRGMTLNGLASPAHERTPGQLSGRETCSAWVCFGRRVLAVPHRKLDPGVVVLVTVLCRRSTVTLGHHTSSAVNTTASTTLCHGPANFSLPSPLAEPSSTQRRFDGMSTLGQSGLVRGDALTVRSGPWRATRTYRSGD
jgi:hypothetical protein